MLKILIAEDQKLLRESFSHIIEKSGEMKVAALASNGQEAVDLCPRTNPDIVLMDLSMPVMNGIEATRMIKSRFPGIKVLILTSSEDESDVAEAIRNGADGYVLKTIGTEELMLSIKSAASGLQIIQKNLFRPGMLGKEKEAKTPKGIEITVGETSVNLTARELSVIKMVVEGKGNGEIAEALYIAEGTVKNVVTEIISKLQLKDRTQLAVFALRNNLA